MSAAVLHSKLSPSGARIWVPCTASVDYITAGRAAGTIPEDDSSTFSREGDEAHTFAARVNNGAVKITAVPEAFRPHVKVFTDECELVFAKREHASRLYVEDKIPLFYAPDESGTIDYAVAGFDIGIHIRDLKYGKGVYVDHEENYQLAIYANSIRCDIERKLKRTFFDDDSPVTMGIVQPRYSGAAPVRIWETTVGELKDFCLKVADSVLTIRTRDSRRLKFSPSEDNCRFCPARFIPCEHMARAALVAIPKISDPLSLLPTMAPVLPNAHGLTDEQLVAVKRSAPMLKQFIDNVDEVLEVRANTGLMPPGLKWVKGREGNREWADPKAAAKILHVYLDPDEYAPRKLVSPTQAKPLLPLDAAHPTLKAQFEDLVTRAPAKVVLALDEDPRPAVAPGALRDAAAATTIDKLPELE